MSIGFCFQRVSQQPDRVIQQLTPREILKPEYFWIYSSEMDSTLNQVIVDSTLKHGCDLWTVVWSDAGTSNS